MRFSSSLLQAGLVLALAASSPAAVVVGGTADIWLAGQPSGTTVGGDTAPAASPVLVSVVAGNILTFAVTGSISHDSGGCFGATADGGCIADVSVFGTGPAFGIGNYKGPANALIAVFLDGAVPTGPGGPASLDFTVNTSFASLAPVLNQVFFIGDGLTGTGSGSLQQFVVPTGATRLFLASADQLGSNFNNLGSFNVDISATPSGVPEPGTWTLLGAGLALVAHARRRRTQ